MPIAEQDFPVDYFDAKRHWSDAVNAYINSLFKGQNYFVTLAEIVVGLDLPHKFPYVAADALVGVVRKALGDLHKERHITVRRHGGQEYFG